MATFQEVAEGDVVVVSEPHHPEYIYNENKARKNQIGLLCEKTLDRASIITKTGLRKTVGDKTLFRKTKKVTREKFMSELSLDKANFQRAGGYYAGSDPEIFVVDDKDVVIPAFDVLPNKKNQLAYYGGGCFYDGFQCEFTVQHGGCHAHFVDRIQAGLVTVINHVRKINPKAKLSWAPIVEIPKEIMDKAPDHGVELGCAPSLNAYGDPPLQLIGITPREIPFRFAGCHYHIGDTVHKGDAVVRIVKAIDTIAGVASVSALEGMEDPRRRQFYGKAGEYRTPSHGIEYRVMSSAILAHPILTHIFFDLIRCSAKIGADCLISYWSANHEETIHCINNLDVKLAREILHRNEKMMHKIFDLMYGANGKKAHKLVVEGAQNYLDVSSMDKNWYINGQWGGHSSSKNCSMATSTF